MKIVIPDDYEDMIGRLQCFALLEGHEVTRYRTPARDLDELAGRLGPAEVAVAIREGVVPRRPALAGRPGDHAGADRASAPAPVDRAGRAAFAGDRLRRRNRARHPRRDRVERLARSAGRARDRADARGPPQHRERGRADEVWRMARQPVTPAARQHLGIFGLGQIGSLVAEAGQGLGMQVLVWGRKASRAKARAAGYAVAASQAELFERADVLQLLVRLSHETRGIVTAADLARMKPAALFVNVARAALVEPGALVAALRSGRPGSAAVDVYEQEPVTGGDHPLLKMPNVLCTPHLGWAEWETFELYFGECFEQIAAFAAGRSLRLANPEVAGRAR
jgi:D-3-phosphoglycerate dehydrogenase